MRLAWNGKTVGLAAGAVAGLLFVLLGWKAFLILLAFTVFGLVVGFWVDSQPGMTRRLREVLSRLFLR